MDQFSKANNGPGPSSEAFSTTVQPAAKAGPTFTADKITDCSKEQLQQPHPQVHEQSMLACLPYQSVENYPLICRQYLHSSDNTQRHRQSGSMFRE